MIACMPFLNRKGKALNSLGMAKATQTGRNGLVNMRRTRPEKESVEREHLRYPNRHYTKGEDNVRGNKVLLQKLHSHASVKEPLQQRSQTEV